jgi:hypothetical protein
MPCGLLCSPLVLVMVIVVDLRGARWVEKKGDCGLSLVFGFCWARGVGWGLGVVAFL